MKDFCRICIFLTLFNFERGGGPGSWSDHSLFWSLLLKIDPDEEDEEIGVNYLEYARLTAVEKPRLDNTLRLDGVFIEQREDSDEVDLAETRYGIRSNKLMEDEDEETFKYYMPDARTLFMLTRAWNIKNEPVEYH